MGLSLTKEMRDALKHPEKRAKVEDVFHALDKDNRGVLTRLEFKSFAQIVLEHDLEQKKKEGIYKTPLVGSKVYQADFGEIQKKVDIKMIDEYIDHMFDIADKDKNGVLTLKEFVDFVNEHYMNPDEVSGIEHHSKDTIGDAMSGMVDKANEAANEIGTRMQVAMQEIQSQQKELQERQVQERVEKELRERGVNPEQQQQQQSSSSSSSSSAPSSSSSSQSPSSSSSQKSSSSSSSSSSSQPAVQTMSPPPQPPPLPEERDRFKREQEERQNKLKKEVAEKQQEVLHGDAPAYKGEKKDSDRKDLNDFKQQAIDRKEQLTTGQGSYVQSKKNTGLDSDIKEKTHKDVTPPVSNTSQQFGKKDIPSSQQFEMKEQKQFQPQQQKSSVPPPPPLPQTSHADFKKKEQPSGSDVSQQQERPLSENKFKNELAQKQKEVLDEGSKKKDEKKSEGMHSRPLEKKEMSSGSKDDKDKWKKEGKHHEHGKKEGEREKFQTGKIVGSNVPKDDDFGKKKEGQQQQQQMPIGGTVLGPNVPQGQPPGKKEGQQQKGKEKQGQWKIEEQEKKGDQTTKTTQIVSQFQSKEESDKGKKEEIKTQGKMQTTEHEEKENVPRVAQRPMPTAQ